MKSKKAKVKSEMLKSLNRAKPNTDRWKRQSAAGHRADAYCSSVSQIFLPVAFCLFTLISACSDTFQPIQDEPDHPFTIYGHLDASLDTNWVRITPVRDTLYLTAGSVTDAVASLTHIETENTVSMNKTLDQILTNVYVFNWWTSMKLEPGQSYQLVAQKPDGRSSRAAVTLPDAFPDPRIIVDNNEVTIYAEGINKLADVIVKYFVRSERDFSIHEYQFRHLQDTVKWELPPGQQQLEFGTGNHFTYIAEVFYPFPYTILGRYLYIVSAGPEWIDFQEYDDKILEIPGRITNIENGDGYLIGVVSKTLEF